MCDSSMLSNKSGSGVHIKDVALFSGEKEKNKDVALEIFLCGQALST